MARNRRFLLLTQDPRLAADCAAALQDRQGAVVEVRDAHLLSALLDRGADLVLVDLNLPDRALQVVAAELGRRREVPAVILTGGPPDAWDRISSGNPLEKVVHVPVDAAALSSAAADLVERSRFLQERLVGRSAAILEIREQILLVGPTPVTVLITGESGTGKDVVAQALHHYSDRSDRPFKPINCAAIPESLLENELFGHERGAYTDARGQHRGIFEQAEGGTVFLDEIGEMSLSAQVRLLRVLEERRVTRIGGDTAFPVDVRVVAASNKDLLAAVSRGEFRRDLYYRLKVVPLHLPPLRQRREDIPLLIEHWVERLARDRHGARFAGFTAEAMELLGEYHWPGNVRELLNLLERLVFLGPARQVGPQDLLPHLEDAPSMERHLPVPTHKTPDQSERELIYFALLDLKREVAELRRSLEVGAAEGGSRPLPRAVFQVDAEAELAEVGEARRGDLVEAGNGAVRPLKELERDAIARALEQVDHNRRRAAALLGIGERTLYRKLDEYGLK